MYSHVSATIKGLVRKHCGTFHSRIGIVLETRKYSNSNLFQHKGGHSPLSSLGFFFFFWMSEFIGLTQRGFCTFSDGDGFPITSLARQRI